MIAEDQGCQILVETHPWNVCRHAVVDAAADRRGRSPALGINFDTLPVWEGGDDPVAAHRALCRTFGTTI